MKRLLNVALFAAVICIATSNFSGCSGAPKQTPGTATASAGLGPAPDVTFKDLQGNNVTLASMKGKVVLLNFWATWCDPCHEEIPWMIQLQQKYADKGFTMLGAAMDDEGVKIVQPFVQKTQFDVQGHPTTMNYPIVIANDDIASKFGGLIGLPTSVMISRDGTMAKRYIGLVSEDTVEKEIRSLL
jgi:thiol-disulfide isomerase/thioredoxin